jgi:glyoxylase-like metal-dependent hydrolase (beta-lactamase superfamily II)
MSPAAPQSALAARVADVARHAVTTRRVAAAVVVAALVAASSAAHAQSGSPFDGTSPDRVSYSASDKDARSGMDRAERTVDGIETYHVQGNVYMLIGSGANVAVQTGADGVLVVDTGGAAKRAAVLAAIRRLSTGPIRWIVNTSADPDHTGGNETISQAGQTVNGNPAAIIAHENVLARMTEANRPITELPLNTFFEPARDFYFNGEAVFLYHPANAHSDGDVFVYFRGSDVLVSGDVFTTTQYPVIRASEGGSVDGVVAAMNQMLDIAVPKYLQEGGTYVIPGHGRVCDEAELLDYRDMVVIVRDRIRNLAAQGKTLEQVMATKPALDYDGRYDNPRGPWTSAMFIEAIYRDAGKTTSGKQRAPAK